jgi:ATP-dependent helicase/DNAse subunit B
MAVNIYQAGAWHEFHIHKERWMGMGPRIVIIPENDEKQNIISNFAELSQDTVLTIPELITRHIKNRGGKGLISLHVMESILGLIINESIAPYMKMEKYRQSYAKALADFIYNFRKSSLSGLKSVMTEFKAGNLSFKEKDLIRIYDEYEKKLPQYGFDLRRGMEEFLDSSPEDIRKNIEIDEYENVVFLGFDYITQLEHEFIYKVFECMPRTSFLLCLEKNASIQAMCIRESIKKLLERSKHIIGEHEILPLRQHDFFTVLSRSIFKPEVDKNIAEKMQEQQDKIIILQANSRFREIVSIARKIMELTEDGVTLDNIRIIAPSYRLYLEIIEEVFPGYGIHFIAEQGVPILRFPLAVLIHNLINLGISSNPYLLKEKILSSPYISFIDKVGPGELEAFQRGAGVELLSGEKIKTYLKPLNYRLDFRYIKNMLTKAYRSVKPDTGTPQLEVIRRYINKLTWENSKKKEKHLLKCLIQSYLLEQAEKALFPWHSRMSADKFAETLQNLIKRFHVLDSMEVVKDSVSSSPDTKVSDRDVEVLACINKLLLDIGPSLASEVESAKSLKEKVTMAELARVFLRLMDEASLPQEHLEGAVKNVTVQKVGRGQYRKWDYTFICGMVEGEFPAEEEFNFLQPQKEGLGLGQTYTSVDHGRNHFYHLISSTAVALFASRPLADNGKRLPPSPFLSEIQKYTIEKVSDSSVKENGNDTCCEKLYNLREKQLFIGKYVDCCYDRVLPLLKEMENDNREFLQNIMEIMRFDGLTLSSNLFSEFDGLFCKDTSSLQIKTYLKKDIERITFTPEVFERYAACPMRFFLDDILHLNPVMDYNPDTAENGILIHSVLKEYTDRACAEKGVPPDAQVIIKNLIERYLKEQEQEGTDAFQARFTRMLTAGMDKPESQRPGLFMSFLDYEKNGPDYLTPYLPGIKGTVKLENGPEIHVEVDRVDVTAKEDYLICYLYTVNKDWNQNRIKRGLSFNLPLAVLSGMEYAEEKHLGQSVAGAGYYLVKTAKSIRRGGYFALKDIRTTRREGTSIHNPVFSGQREGFFEYPEFYDALKRIRKHMARLYSLMHEGVFHLPLCYDEEQTCSNCIFNRVCRKDQMLLEKLRNNITLNNINSEKLNFIRNLF